MNTLKEIPHAVGDGIHKVGEYLGIVSPPPPPQTWQDDVLMRSIKMLDIGYIFLIYFTLAVGLSMFVDKMLGKFNPDAYKTVPNWQIMFELFLAFWMYGIACYIIRNLVELIPFPLDGYHGFQHKKVKELSSAWVFGFVFLTCSSNMSDRLKYFYNRYTAAEKELTK